MREFRRQLSKTGEYQKLILHPRLFDKKKAAGKVTGHYFIQDYHVARKIFINNPKRHIDIGSSIYGFVAHVAIFRPIEVLDIRELKSPVENIYFRRADIMKPPEDLINACDSISSLHALEHVGLGRYGDSIDADGFRKAFSNIARMLKKDGIFYLSVPIGAHRIEFNAHRVFSLSYLLKLIPEYFVLENFSYIDDNSNFFESAVLLPEKISNNFNCRYGCGIFELRKSID